MVTLHTIGWPRYLNDVLFRAISDHDGIPKEICQVIIGMYLYAQIVNV